MKILKSLEAFVFEVITWLVFYPITFWKVLRHPLQMMGHAYSADPDDADRHYDGLLSPPIFLAISISLAHLLELGMGVKESMPDIIADEQNLLGFRILLFSIYPLILSIRYLRRRGLEIDRTHLRPPFYAQSFVIAPYAMVVGMVPVLVGWLIGESTEGDTQRAMVWLLVLFGLLLLATIWFLAIQAKWFAHKLNITVAKGVWHAVVCFFQGLALVVLITSAINYF